MNGATAAPESASSTEKVSRLRHFAGSLDLSIAKNSIRLLYGDRAPAGAEPETDGAQQEVGGQRSAQPVQPI